MSRLGAIGGRLSGKSIRLSATNSRNAVSGGAPHGTKFADAAAGLRLTSAPVPFARQTMSGSRPMIE